MLTCNGTIPYLGTYLTDLTMLHTHIPDTLGENKLINFDKKRKEFEVVAHIKLLQGAAKAYHLTEDPLFDTWFSALPEFSDAQAHDRSCILEPQDPPIQQAQRGHRKSDSIASTSSSGAGSQFYCDINPLIVE